MTSSPELAAKSCCCCGLKGWLLLWTLLFVAEVALLANNAALDSLSWRTTRWVMGDQDAYTWEKTRAQHTAQPAAPFYYRLDPPMHSRLYKRTEKLWRVLRDLGEPVTTLILFAAVCLYDQRRRWRAGAVLASAAIIAGLLGTLVRMISGRYRPNAEITLDNGIKLANEGGNYWHMFRGFYEGSDLAFPSGHATLAFATAAALTYLSPRGKTLFITIAAGTALSRVVMQAHFYSDVLLGSVLGWTLGWLVAKAADRALTLQFDPPVAAAPSRPEQP
jgi:membrane-associated phospholipid phosphatase